MPHTNQLIETCYDALLFAKSPDSARQAAKNLVKAVLGEEAAQHSLSEGLRECCRVLRPARDPKDQPRFEEEFLELGCCPEHSKSIAA
jgi:hypothetical protein